MNFVDFRPLLGKLSCWGIQLQFGSSYISLYSHSGNCYVQCGVFLLLLLLGSKLCPILFYFIFCLEYESSFSGDVLLAVLGALESSQNQNMCP